jgi:hypothetical protein
MPETTATMRRLLDLIGVADADQLADQHTTHLDNLPLRRVNDLLAAALLVAQHGEQIMRREINALKRAADPEISLLERGYPTTGWLSHHAGKVQAGRYDLVHGVGTITALAPLRQMLLADRAGSDPDAGPRP